METVFGLVGLLVGAVAFMIFIEWMREHRKATLAILCLGIGAAVLYAYYPDLVATAFNDGAIVAVGGGLLVFVWAAPFLLVGFIIVLAIKFFAGAVASEVVRQQKERQ